MELKKRKLSVSSVLTIVLAVLLVLSLSIGFTGAWFTSKANLGSISLGSLTLGKIEVSAEASAVKLYGADANNSYAKGAEVNDRTYVVPGDYIEATITITNTSTADAYILVYETVGAKWYNMAGTEVTVDGALTSALAVDGADGSFPVSGQVPTSEVQSTPAKSVNDYVKTSYKVVAVQADNISQTDAWAQLKGLIAE